MKTIYPTLNDCRNLLFSISKQIWSSKSSLIEVIDKIPSFLQRVKEDTEFKTLVYYGDYNLLRNYNMNDFMVNPNEIGKK